MESGIELSMPRQENGGNQIENLSKTKKKPKKILRCMAGFVLGLCLLFSAATIAGILWLKAGIDSSFLTARITAALREKIGDIAVFDLARARVSLDENYQLVLQASDVTFKLRSDGVHVDKIGQIRALVDMNVLFKGEVHVTHVAMRDIVARLPNSGGGSFLDKLPQDGLGRVDFDATSDLVFNQFSKVLPLFASRGINALVLDNLALHFSYQGKMHMVQWDSSAIERTESQISLAASLQWQGMQSTLRGQITHDADGILSDFAFFVNEFPLSLGTDDTASPLRADGSVRNNFFRLKGLASFEIRGLKDKGEGKNQIHLGVQLPQARADLGTYSGIGTFLTFKANHQRGSDMIVILPDSAFGLGSLQLPLDGFFSPMALDENRFDSTADIRGKYHFKLKANGAEVAPEESPEQKMMFSVQASGSYQVDKQHLNIDELALLTAGGSLTTGRGGLHFGAGSPGLSLQLETEHIAASEAKQLWPLTLNPGARRWVLTHVKAGALADVHFDVNLPRGFYHEGRPAHALSEEQVSLTARLEGVGGHLVGDLPPVQNMAGTFALRGTTVTIEAMSGEFELAGDMLAVRDGQLAIMRRSGKPALLETHFSLVGHARPVARLVSLHPINVHRKLPLTPLKIEGDITARVHLQFPLEKQLSPQQIIWHVSSDFHDFSSPSPVDGNINITKASGHMEINSHDFSVKMAAFLNAIPADIALKGKTQDSSALKSEKITLVFNDALRTRLAPALANFISGDVKVDVGAKIDGMRMIHADLTGAVLSVPWLDWKKAAGIAANLEFSWRGDATATQETLINDFRLQGKDFQLVGNMVLQGGRLQRADFSRANLHAGDNMQLALAKSKAGYRIQAAGKRFDARPFLKTFGSQTRPIKEGDGLELDINIDEVQGFYGEALHFLRFRFNRNLQGRQSSHMTAMTRTDRKIEVAFEHEGQQKILSVNAGDGGSLLRFMNYYDRVDGGILEVRLRADSRDGTNGQAMHGPLLMRDFFIVNEPKLARFVSSTSTKGGKSLNDVVKKKIDTSQVYFERAFAQMTHGENFLILDDAIVSGPTVGATFQGIVYDAAGDITMTGTFMPAYGLNRMFGDVPVLGAILGNGRDRGLIGLTFKIDGKMKEPHVTVNPISAIAPGIFRQIFEFQQ